MPGCSTSERANDPGNMTSSNVTHSRASEALRAIEHRFMRQASQSSLRTQQGVATITADDYQGDGVILGAATTKDLRGSMCGSGILPGDETLLVLLAEEMGEEHLRRALFDQTGVAAANDDTFVIQTHVVGAIEAYSQRLQQRPAGGGLSIGHVGGGVGTMACLVRGLGARSNRLLALGSNHALAGANIGRTGEAVVQPASVDGGRDPNERVGVLERVVTIDFGGNLNYADAATVWVYPERVRAEESLMRRGKQRTMKLSDEVVHAEEGQSVGKIGRTTGLTQGRVVSNNAVVRVLYGTRVAIFADQLLIESVGDARAFAAPGDSGALITTWDDKHRPVGMVMAGCLAGQLCVANKMQRVLDAVEGAVYVG